MNQVNNRGSIVCPPPAAWRLAVVVAALPGTLFAQLTARAAIHRRRIDQLVTSRDGSLAAFVVSEPAKGAETSRHVFLYRRGSDRAAQFTWSAKSEWSPRFSSDGTRLAFLSNRGERTAIWIMSMDGGEAQVVETGKLEVEGFDWAPDGRSIAFLASPQKPDSEDQRIKDKDDARVVDRDSLTALWIVDLGGKPARRLTRPPWGVSEFQWLPGGDRLALLVTDRPDHDRWADKLGLIGVGDTVPRILAQPTGPIDGIQVTPDGAGISYLGPRLDGPTSHDLYYQPIDGGPARNLTGTVLDRPIDAIRWLDRSRAVLVIQDGFRTRLELLGLDGTRQPAPALPVDPRRVAALGSGGLIVVGERTTEAPEVWLVPEAGSPRKVTELNASAFAGAVKPELFRYRSFDRTEVEAALLVPPGRKAGERLPLVVLVHGGPTGAWLDRFDPWGQLLVSRGYAVLYPNVRGSTGYGWKFLEANRADWGGGDFKDLMVGVDTVIGRGIADPDRLGIGGWSYGGYMASWAITQTTRFKAAITGAGMSDLATEYGTERYPAYDEWFYGTPYERPDGFRKSSPLTWITKARTPTLVLQGEEDSTDPVSQSQMLYRALKRYGVPTELVLYPREEHGFREEKHQLDLLNRVVAWFERWLGSARPPVGQE
jgi:dipeptidyl aminopeptidase/acylaminoacyl peptidase